MKTLLFIALLFAATLGTAFSHSDMVKLPLSLRVGMADIVIEGTVISSYSLSLDNTIYTAFRVTVHKVFKGTVAASEVEVISPGGFYNGTFQVVEPTFTAHNGQTGLFMVTHRPDLQTSSSIPRFYAFAAQQSLVTYHKHEGFASDMFHRYTDISHELYIPIRNHIGGNENIVSSFNADDFIAIPHKDEQTHQSVAADIISITPTLVRGGLRDTLTIFLEDGVSFGTFRNQATVEFKNADDGGQTWISVPPNHIILWQPGIIKVIVPGGDWYTLNETKNVSAGTGLVRVKRESGLSVTSTQVLTVISSVNSRTYQTNQTNPPVYETFRPHFINQNGFGGYTFRPSFALKQNTQAVNVFKRSLETWRCGTGINFSYSDETSTANCAKNDNINTVALSSVGCPMPFVGVLAYTSSIWVNQPCLGSDEMRYFTIIEMDMVINKDINWNYSTELDSVGKYDLESIITHELGHAHQLGHIIDPSKVMNFAIDTSTFRRSLNAFTDIPAGIVINDSSIALRCSAVEKFSRIPTDQCSADYPKAWFSHDTKTPIEGCAPLTVDFKNLSVNSPEFYLWDTDGDGANDDFKENPTTTFTKPGQYSVRLIANNGDWADTVIRKNYITVYDAPRIATIPSFTICKDSTLTIGGTDIISGGTSPYTFSWSPAASIVSGRTNAVARVKPTTTTVYTVIVSDKNGCIGRDTVTVTVLENIKPVIARKGDTLSVNATGIIQWLLDGNPIPNATGNRFVPANNGIYSVRVTNQIGCAAVSDGLNVTITSLEDIPAQDISIAYDYINNNLNLHGAQGMKAELYSLVGNSLSSTLCTDTVTTISTAGLSSGLYFIRITNTTQSFVFSFIIH